MSDLSFDFLFIGGGILGSSCSMALAKGLEDRGQSASIGVIDLDLEGEHSSTLKNAGGVRSTWRNPANIELCKYSIDYYETIKQEIQFRQLGYYWMHDEKSWHEVRENYPLYRDYEIPVELYDTDEVQEILPFVDNLGGISGLSISKKAGLIDHYSLREHYRREARKMGVQFLDRIYVTDIVFKDRTVYEVRAYDLKEDLNVEVEQSEIIKNILIKGLPEDFGGNLSLGCDVLINTAGAWAPRISKLYGFHDDNVKPRRRQMVVINCPGVDLSHYGLVIDTSGVYLHKESDNILIGYSNLGEPYGYNLDYSFGGIEEESLFVKYIWSPLWKRSGRFERVKVIRGWAGLYAETPDRSGYLGRVPGLKNVFECVAHTGRGLMISYGAGMALSDLILNSEFREELRHAGDLSRDRPSGELFEELHL